MAEQTCQERVKENFEGRIDDLRKLWAAEQDGNEDGVEDLGTLNEYGLAFDFVAPYTFTDQADGYFRYQISTGGPGDEFRFYAQKVNDYTWTVYKIEYWFLDWFDGAHVNPTGDDYKFLKNLFESYFAELGAATAEYDKAMEDWTPPEDESSNEDEE
jgi:hypothetical protein